MASRQERERVAIELKTWLRSQTRFKTIRALEEPTGIPYSSLRDYFCGHAAPAGERLRSLANLARTPTLLALLARMAKEAPSDQASHAEEIAREVRKDVDRLLADIEFFKRASAPERAVLRSLLPARDVGYLTSLLKAMYDEDQFQTWLYFTEYKPESR